MRLVRETGLKSDGGDWIVAAEKAPGDRHAELSQICVWCHPDASLKFSDEVIQAHADVIGEVG